MVPDQRGTGRGRDATRGEIIQAALSRFMRQGYNNTTMDDIVAQSGLSKGTLYWYFDSKENLFQAALLSIFEGFGEDLLSTVEPCETATEKLRRLGRGAAAFGESVGGYFTLFLEFWASRPRCEEANRVWYDLLEEYKTILAAIVEEGVASGEFRPVETESLIWALMAAYDGMAAYAGFIPDLDLERIGETLMDVVLLGLRRRTDEKDPSHGT